MFFSTETQILCFVCPSQHGADPNKKNRDGQTPLDLVKEGDQDVADLLRGELKTVAL